MTESSASKNRKIEKLCDQNADLRRTVKKLKEQLRKAVRDRISMEKDSELVLRKMREVESENIRLQIRLRVMEKR